MWPCPPEGQESHTQKKTGTEGGREGETVKERKKWKRKGEKEKVEEGRNLGINDFRYSRIQEYKI